MNIALIFARFFETHVARVERGGGVLPYNGLMGTCGQPGYVFRDFCLKQGIDFIIFRLKQRIFLNSFVIVNGVNRKEFRYLLLSYTGYGFRLNVLNRVRI